MSLDWRGSPRPRPSQNDCLQISFFSVDLARSGQAKNTTRRTLHDSSLLSLRKQCEARLDRSPGSQVRTYSPRLPVTLPVAGCEFRPCSQLRGQRRFSTELPVHPTMARLLSHQVTKTTRRSQDETDETVVAAAVGQATSPYCKSLSRWVEVVEHEIDNHAAYRDVEPDRKRPARNFYVFIKLPV